MHRGALHLQGGHRDNGRRQLALGKLWRADAGRLPGPSYCYKMIENNFIEGADHLIGALTKISQL